MDKMDKNWYAVYTKAQCEKKVASLLTKKKIENFCPLNRRILNSQSSRRKILQEPLFPSFVFAYLSPAEMYGVKQTSDVISFLYWLGNPAVIKTPEIENIDFFVNSYFNVKLEKTVVNPAGAVSLIKMPRIDLNLGTRSSGTTCIKLTLPSLGFCITAETENNAEIITSDYEILKF